MCIFCKIISGELPSYKVYEDEKTLAFLDIKPVNAGHVLVAVKNHFKNLEDTPEEDVIALIVTVKRIGLLLKEKLGVPGYNLSVNNDPVADQLVPHLHFHIIPRRAGDGLPLWPQREYDAGEAEIIMKKLLS